MLRPICAGFLGEVDSIYRAYMDATLGFKFLVEKIISLRDTQLQAVRNTDPGLATDAYLDSLPMLYGRGDPNTPEARLLSSTTQGDYKRRNMEGGESWSFLGNVCIVAIFQLWEDRYRGEIATALGQQKDQIINPVMGDLRLLRNSIIHHAGVALPEVDRCEILRFFRPGDRIAIHREHFDLIVAGLRQLVSELQACVDAG